MSSSIFSTHRLHNKTVLITGASGGIGKSTALLYARAGANVILTARRLDALEAAKQECEAANAQGNSGAGGKYAVITLDVTKREEVDGLLAKLPDWASSVDILVNNSGLVLGVERVGDIKYDDIDIMFNTNVRGLIHMTQVFVKHMKERNSGHIVTLGSIAGRLGYPGGAIYCATKAAVRNFNEALLKELVDTNIRLTEIQPGAVETNFSVTRYRGDQAAADKVYEGLTPLTPEDIAEDIVFATSRPPHVNVTEVLIFPKAQAGPFHYSRKPAAK
ncbi:unnamed protein product [Tilletia controversa]|uniref:Ketoreductase domain-containing protein n=3 Tax=Tilletia TaxID=13289 RepID=A0A8X7MRT5_9BASI|nr:hypothetical protein CF336_g4352 [Tilletia laevis]KAE8196397.1 hypothetical protein CF328_g4149 [Tilletia controversa]KAE8260383.1 hypothetical protein A4X03_0g3837 [Tilletia caries]KAE8202172.1 hypothetical protein CF335_g3517 [Tilletia laevis]KAE8246898.1 hypothetical protein A4X06_0g4833 [Tilletia controversa]